MVATIKWEGLDKLTTALEERGRAADTYAKQAVAEAAHTVQLAMQQKANTGRHAPGAPTSAVHGSGPNVVTGNLRRSIIVSPMVNIGGHGWQAMVGPTAVYGRQVELTYDYPYAGPGLRDALPQLGTIFARAFAKAWK